MTEYVLSLSYGKDSIACIFAIKALGWPLDRIVHAEVWATDTIPADLPPMVEFKAKADEIIYELIGIRVEHLCATRNGEKLTYEKLFYHIPNRKPGGKFSDGSSAGFPYQKGAWCNDRLKTNTLDAISDNGGGAITGFPYRQGAWCNGHLKIPALRAALRVPVHNRELVQEAQRRDLCTFTPPPTGWPLPSMPWCNSGLKRPCFPKAPLHKERRKILCSTSASPQMSLSV